MRLWLSVFLLLISTNLWAVTVDVAAFSGRLSVSSVDILFQSNTEMTPNLKRHYIGGGFGKGWQHTYDMSIFKDDQKDQVRLFIPGKNSIHFLRTNDSVQKRPYQKIYRSADSLQTLKVGRYDTVLSDKNGISYVFNYEGQLIRMSNQRGQHLKLLRSGGRLFRIDAPYGRWVKFSYNTDGLLKKVTGSNGQVREYTYDLLGRLTAVKTQNDKDETYIYRGKRLQKITESHKEWHVTEDRFGRVKQLIRPYHYVQRFEYEKDVKGLTYRIINPENAITTYRSENGGKTFSMTNPLGGVTAYRFDNAGQIEQITDPVGHVTTIAYDDVGRISEILKPGDQKTTYRYKKENRKPSVIRYPSGQKIKYEFNEFGEVITIKDSAFGKQQFAYDTKGRLAQMKSKGKKTVIAYQNSDQPARIDVDGKPAAQFNYGEFGEVASLITPEGSHIERMVERRMTDQPVSLKEAGKDIASKDGTLTYRYDAAGRVTGIDFQTGLKQHFSYNGLGRVTAVAVGQETVETNSYDAAGQLIQKKYADGSTLSYGYTPNGALASKQTSDGARYKYEYDAFGRMASATFPGFKKLYEYSDTGVLERQQLSIQKEAESSEFNLFGDDLMVVKSKFKSDDNRYIRIVSSPGLKSRHIFEQGRLHQIDSEVLGTFLFNKGPDAEQKITYPNGITEQLVHTEKGFQKIISTEGNELLNLSLTMRDQQIGTYSINGLSDTFEYDDRGQLKRVTSPNNTTEYGYDLLGNRLETQSDGVLTKNRFSPTGRLIQSGQTTYQWDVRGNVKQTVSEPGQTHFEYDIENRLRAITSPAGERVEYQYDENGLLIARKTGSQIRYYIYDGINLVAIVGKPSPNDKKMTVLTAFLYEIGVNKPVGMIRLETVSDGKKVKQVYQKYYLHRDHLDNVIMVSDESGKVAATYKYSPFGELQSKTGRFLSPLLYGSHLYEPKFGLYYMKARFYNPSQGRFLSADPIKGNIEDALSTNLYLYVKNNPVTFNDPLGLSPSAGTPTAPLTLLQDPKKLPSLYETAHRTSWDTFKDSSAGFLIETFKEGSLAKYGEEVILSSKKDAFFTRMFTNDKVIKHIEKTSTTHTNMWIGGKLVYTMANGAADYASGKKSGADFFVEDVLVETGAAGLEYYATQLGSTALSGAGALSGPALAYGVVVNWSLNNVKDALKEGWQAVQAAKNADFLEKHQKDNDLNLVSQKFQQITDLVNKGDIDSLKEAQRLADGLSDFTSERWQDDGRLIGLDTMAYDLHSAISDSISDFYKKKTEEFNRLMEEREKARQEALKKQREEERKDFENEQKTVKQQPAPKQNDPSFENENVKKVQDAHREIIKNKQLAHNNMMNFINFMVHQERLRIQRNKEALLMTLQILAATVNEAATIYQIYQDAGHQSKMNSMRFRSDLDSAYYRHGRTMDVNAHNRDVDAAGSRYDYRQKGIDSNYYRRLNERQLIFEQKLNTIVESHRKYQ